MKLFLDLDGVLADFNAGVEKITGRLPHEQSPKDMWKALAFAKDFYYSLDFMPDALELWEFAKPYNPTILTGLPMGNWAKGQKVRWVGEKLGWDVPIITCFARDKQTYAKPGDILVDDRHRTEAAWKSVGGIFVLHISAADSIEQLKKLL